MTNSENVSQQTEDTKITPTNKPHSKKKRWCCVLGGISAVILVPVFVLVGMLSTNAGQIKLIKLADQWLDALSIEQVSGGLQDGLTLQQIRYQSEGVDTLIEQAHLQLDFHCLWQRKICLEDLRITHPQILIDTAKLPPSPEEEDKDTTPMQRINLPISVEVKNVEVDNLLVKIDNSEIQLGLFKSAATLNNASGLTLLPTQFEQLYFTVHDQEDVQKVIDATANAAKETAANVKDAVVNAQQQADNTPLNTHWNEIEQQLAAPLLANLHQIELPFDMHITNIQGKDWRYVHHTGDSQQTITIPHVQLQADATDYTVQLTTFDIESSLGNLHSQGTIQLNEDFPLNLHLHGNIHEFNTEQETLLPDTTLDLTLSGSLRKQTALELKTTGIDALLTANVSLNEPKTPFQLQLSSPQIRYPFKGNDPFIAKNIDLNAQGNLLDYQIQFSGNAQGMGIPAAQLKLAISGGLTQAKIDNAQLNALNGTTTLTGQVDWKEGLQWQSAVNLDKINTATHWKDWAATLSGTLESSGYAKSHDWLVKLPVLDLQGTFSGRPLSLKGQLDASQDNLLTIPQLTLNYGDNHIQVKGHLNDTSDLKLTINAPNLSGLLPNFSAALSGNAHIQGSIREPQLNIDLVGNNIRFQDMQLTKASIQSNIHSQQQIQGQADIKLNGFQYGETKISQLALNLQGNEQQHTLTLRSQGDPVAANLDLSGSFDRTSQIWKGSLGQTNIRSPIGNISKNQAVNIEYDNTQLSATIAPHCWHSTEIELCFPQTFKAGVTGEVPFDIRKLDLTLVNKLTEQDQLLTGQLKSQGKVAWFSDKPFTFDINVEGNNLAVSQKIQHNTFKLAIPSLNVEAKLVDNNANLKSQIRLQDQATINADLQVQDIQQKRQLGGTLDIRQLNLRLFNQLLSRGDNINGQVNANLRFGGNAETPLLNGSFNANNLKMNMASLPLEISDGELNIDFHGNRSTLQGNIQSNNSRLSLEGDASWHDINRWEANLAAKANEFRVDIPNMARLRISPDVRVTATPTLLELSGEINIPWARIEVEELPESAVTVSSDEVILTHAPTERVHIPTTPRQGPEGMLIKSDLTINIGDNVWLDAYGLKSGLTGLLSVRQEKGKLGLYGQVNMKNGRYASFGQDLLIRKGQISFSGLPSQPLLNIEAIRNPEAMEDTNVTAGVKVTGVADSPEVSIFSEPSMPQDQALSYILTGRSLENSGDAGSSGSIGAALLGLSLAKSGKLVGGIGEAFGIRDLNLGTQGVGDSSKVVVSGYITPRLQVKYGVGLFDGLAEFTLRYRLMPQLYLQSVSGVTQAFDLLYQFEF
ncbi:translocation/assembly module TamB domain-containing protein [Conservatibacter flavescens]|uniref:DUF490 domain-containing protein n=1 Tax=Conservatibacter flavescens TaxID=28161 RepID=A0A2M8S4Z2_9PAST|nr:translocation/assembly module TamB domain-containing protein [Conservatibacter flavescens]PJG86168.1 DUF490 domain-containing protein [Conservatibacter flavescens]